MEKGVFVLLPLPLRLRFRFFPFVLHTRRTQLIFLHTTRTTIPDNAPAKLSTDISSSLRLTGVPVPVSPTYVWTWLANAYAGRLFRCSNHLMLSRLSSSSSSPARPFFCRASRARFIYWRPAFSSTDAQESSRIFEGIFPGLPCTITISQPTIGVPWSWLRCRRGGRKENH